MGKLIPSSRGRPAPRAHLTTPTGVVDADSNYELLPVAALLFGFSIARVGYAVWAHEPFETEPTVALGCVLGLPCLAWRALRK